MWFLIDFIVIQKLCRWKSIVLIAGDMNGYPYYGISEELQEVVYACDEGLN